MPLNRSERSCLPQSVKFLGFRRYASCLIFVHEIENAWKSGMPSYLLNPGSQEGAMVEASDPSRNPPNLSHNNFGSFVEQQAMASTQQDTYPELDKGGQKVRDQQDKDQGRHYICNFSTQTFASNCPFLAGLTEKLPSSDYYVSGLKFDADSTYYDYGRSRRRVSGGSPGEEN